MKRIPATILLLASVLMVFPLSLCAQKVKKVKKVATQRRMMTSEGQQTSSGHRFTIDGQVALDIPDAKYNIYITDIDKEITDADLAGCVDVTDKKFRFETNLSSMKAGRIRAVMPDGNLNPAWISVYFIPGFTLNLSVHNGSFDIGNDSEYSFMVNAWLNKDALAVLFESMGASGMRNANTEESPLDIALESYQDMLMNLQDQLNLLSRQPNYHLLDAERKNIIKRMDNINVKMESLIDKYANSIKY